ncbi:hypothetical protein A2U01_0047081, partial [Trifolium medium]|nr:hypothetical protein [Trifolium medium]
KPLKVIHAILGITDCPPLVVDTPVQTELCDPLLLIGLSALQSKINLVASGLRIHRFFKKKLVYQPPGESLVPPPPSHVKPPPGPLIKIFPFVQCECHCGVPNFFIALLQFA